MTSSPRISALPVPAAVVFDVEGTLLTGSGTNLRSLMTASAEVLGILPNLDYVNEAPYLDGRPLPGVVDSQLMSLLAHRAGRRLEEVREDLLAAYAEVYRQDLATGTGVGQVIPGVEDLLRTLTENGIPVGLATGNIAAIAEMKMAAHGLAEFFSFSPQHGFSDYQDSRLRIGAAAIAALPAADHVYLVGDTIADMESARFNGARGVGVLTGPATRENLSAEGAWVVLDDVTALGRMLFLPA